MVARENRGKPDNAGELDWPFEAGHLNELAHVEIHKSSGEMIGLIFHLGDFSLPILRSRAYQRVGDNVERNWLRPWVIGRATHKGQVMLEGPGQPGILLRDIARSLAEGIDIADDNLLSAAVWINGARLDFRELFEAGISGYSYEEVVVTSVPVLEQRFQTDALLVKMEIALLPDGPVQRTTLEVTAGVPIELDYGLLSMFPKGMTEYYATSCDGKPLEGKVRQAAQGSSTVCVFIPSARWLAIYDPASQWGTLICSPLFEKDKINHVLMLDRRQDSKVYHVAGDCECIAGGRSQAKMVVSPGKPQMLALFARPVEAVPCQWKKRADEQAEQLMDMFSSMHS